MLFLVGARPTEAGKELRTWRLGSNHAILDLLVLSILVLRHLAPCIYEDFWVIYAIVDCPRVPQIY